MLASSRNVAERRSERGTQREVSFDQVGSSCGCLDAVELSTRGDELSLVEPQAGDVVRYLGELDLVPDRFSFAELDLQ